ncbi:MAG: twin transmembrane helix small protein [Pseudomonadota bacterium]
MNIFLTIFLIGAVIATVVMLIRGLIAFLRTTEADLNSEDGGPSQSALKQNKMMTGRVIFQAIAIIIVILILLTRNSG